MLTGKLKMGIFQQAVHEDDELAHDRRHGHERWFACRAQAQIKLFEDPVMSDGAQGGHVKGVPGGAASAADVAQAALITTVAVVRRDARQGGGGLLGERAQFGHFGQHGGGDHGADAGNGIQPFGFAGQFRVLGDERGNGRVALFDLLVQGFTQLPGLAQPEGIGVMLGMVALGDEQLDELAATLGQLGQLLLLGRGRRRGWRLKRRAYSDSTAASMGSVLARWPWARAK